MAPLKHTRDVLLRIVALLLLLGFTRYFLYQKQKVAAESRAPERGFPNDFIAPPIHEADRSLLTWDDPVDRAVHGGGEVGNAARLFEYSPRYRRLEKEVDSAMLKTGPLPKPSSDGPLVLGQVTVILVAIDQAELDSACALVASALPELSAIQYPRSKRAFVGSVLISAADTLDWTQCEATFKDASFMVDLIGATIATFEEAFQTAVTYVDDNSTHVLALEMARGRAAHVLSHPSMLRLAHDTESRAHASNCVFVSCMEYEGTTGVVYSAGLEPIVQIDAELKHFYVGPYGGFLTSLSNVTKIGLLHDEVVTPLVRPTCMLARHSAVASIGIARHLAPGSRLRTAREVVTVRSGESANPRRPTTQLSVADAVRGITEQLMQLEHCMVSVGWYHVSNPVVAAAFLPLLEKTTLWSDAGRDVLSVTGTVFTRAEPFQPLLPFELLPATVWSRVEANVTALAAAVVAAWQAVRAQEVALASRRPLSDSVVELALKLSQQGSSCATTALRIPVSLDSKTTSPADSSAVVAAATEYLSTKVSSYLQMRTQSQLTALRNTTLPIVAWYHQCCYCCGFSNEIVHLTVPLQRKYTLMMMAQPECFCSGFSPYTSSVVNNTGTAMEQYVGHRNHQEPVIWISHTTPVFYNQHVFECNPPSYFVGRSMFEFTPVPEPWLVRSMIADEIWVPSQFVLDAFVASGFSRDKLVLVPEAIDTSLFTPHRPERFVLPHCIFDRIMDPKDAVNVACNVDFPDPFANKDLARRIGASHVGPPFVAKDPFAAHRHPLSQHYKFLSAFKWEERKGWDILLKAYFTAFRRRDPVTLYIVTSIFSADKSQYKHYRDADAVLRWCVNVSNLMGIAQEDMPTVFVITSNLEEVEVAALYRSVDAFVLPSRGEGWGLPVMQAMASGLPTIATDYSGQKDFMAPGTAYPIRITGLEPIPLTNIGVVDVNPSMKWAIPDVKHCAELMRYVMDHREEAKAVGARAAAYIAENFDEAAVFAKHVEPQLQRITEILRTRPAPQGRGGIDC